jgi:hypothetical protein
MQTEQNPRTGARKVILNQMRDAKVSKDVLSKALYKKTTIISKVPEFN